MRHIYVGMSNKRTWCGAPIKRDLRGTLTNIEEAPLTEGEYIDGYYRDGLCTACVEAIEPVRGKPVEVVDDDRR